jgi:uncharacterized membrane protein YhaH (DUF805 family)
VNDRAPPTAGRAAFVISQLYYYIASVIGVGFLIGGAIAALLGLRQAILPQEFETARHGIHQLLEGLAIGLPGLAILVWHLREARGRESRVPREPFWGGSLYFHLVALVALGFIVGGAIALLGSLVDLTLPECFQSFAELGESEAPARGVRECYPSGSEAARNLLDAGIVLIVAMPVWWWHLRQGRKATEAEDR